MSSVNTRVDNENEHLPSHQAKPTATYLLAAWDVRFPIQIGQSSAKKKKKKKKKKAKQTIGCHGSNNTDTLAPMSCSQKCVVRV